MVQILLEEQNTHEQEIATEREFQLAVSISLNPCN